MHAGIGIECVSRGEAEQRRSRPPALDPATILFTPNFAPRSEYEWALGARPAGHGRQPLRAA
jgi:bifunctional diaminopimelate decarboxylase / aspartate kinase